MRLRPGCGCPLLILMVVDIVFLAGAVLTVVRGPSAEPARATTYGAVITLIVMAGNAIACALLAMAAFRRRGLEQAVSDTPTTEDSSEEGEEEDAGSVEDDEDA